MQPEKRAAVQFTTKGLEAPFTFRFFNPPAITEGDVLF